MLGPGKLACASWRASSAWLSNLATRPSSAGGERTAEGLDDRALTSTWVATRKIADIVTQAMKTQVAEVRKAASKKIAQARKSAAPIRNAAAEKASAD